VALADRYDAILLDLDGVLYRGDAAVAVAPDTVAELRRRGRSVVFLTNNSARTPEQVADKLTGLGIEAAPAEVVTSAEATAQLLAREGNGTSAFVIGRDGIREALRGAGIRVTDGEEEAAAVVVGWDGSVTYEALRRATVLVRGGARLVATNADASYPAPGGELWPGAGAILAAVETASGQRATVVGKPHRPLFDAALERAGSRNALMAGDRIETDIAGAAAAGIDAALVLSGAATAADLLDHDPLPAAVLEDVSALLADRDSAPARRAEATDLEAVRSVTDTPEDVPAWGPEGVWVIGDVVATATAEVRGPDAYLRAVATRPELRGARQGTLAVAAAVGDARRRGAAAAWLFTDTAEGFFAGLGFEPVDRAEVPEWIVQGPAEGCAVSAVAMRRALGQERRYGDDGSGRRVR
jgi:HAD superfamily hydrolase (TIGR01457 family)